MTRSILPTQLGLAGAVQIARVDRCIGAKGELHHTWLVSSLSAQDLCAKPWLELERRRWGIENKTHYPLDASFGEDECRVRQPNAVTVLGIFQRIAVALHHRWKKGRPARKATARDWIAEHQGSRWKTLRKVVEPISPSPNTTSQTR